MSLTFAPLHPVLAAECLGVDSGAPLSPADAAAIEDGMDRYAVLVFRRDKPLTTAQQIAFTQSLGDLEAAYTTIHPDEGRRLDLSSHAGRIVGWPVPEAMMLLRELTEHATQREFVYRHQWRVGDLVMWDNQATMHRGRPYDDTKYPRDLRRTTLTCGKPAVAMV